MGVCQSRRAMKTKNSISPRWSIIVPNQPHTLYLAFSQEMNSLEPRIQHTSPPAPDSSPQ
ncbi:hypothetical protein BDZ94DRAFT_1260472 [Collybia nuda]|uniref:Uncharacterized protein n=1 Tax=Collybia nuda TaxID=64659 RepID=A0A9P5Y810_9AGAR|nr:hypothetical protein BDZ94DRAFT_1260472 [Collybia nuda]